MYRAPIARGLEPILIQPAVFVPTACEVQPDDEAEGVAHARQSALAKVEIYSPSACLSKVGDLGKGYIKASSDQKGGERIMLLGKASEASKKRHLQSWPILSRGPSTMTNTILIHLYKLVRVCLGNPLFVWLLTNEVQPASQPHEWKKR